MDTRFFFILLCLIPNWCQGQEWSEPFFEDAKTEGVTFKGFVNSNFEITMDEEISWPYSLVIIKSNTCVGIQIVFQFGIHADLGDALVSIPDESGCVLNITKRQDYENEANRYYKIRIKIGSVSKDVRIVTNNIFDNDPIITYNGPCTINELEDEDFTSSCELEVFDPDGLANNKITHEILGNNNESNIFYLRSMKPSTEYREYYTIIVKQTLYYEETSFYNFKITFYDIVKNTGTINIIIQINDLPSMPPRWLNPFTIQKFDELTIQSFTIEATDGDTGRNKLIKYFLTYDDDDEHDYSKYLTLEPIIGTNKVIIHVSEIDRDERKQEYYYFNISAYKNDEGLYFETPSRALIIIDDINNKLPIITFTPKTIKFRESEYITLPFDEIIVNDMDLGNHASYSVSLSQSKDAPQIYSSAVSIIPSSGYQLSNYFTINVIKAPLLDYEDDLWREFELIIVSTEIYFPNRTWSEKFKIELINWNDELPKFAFDEYSVSVNETFNGGLFLTQVLATDRDIDDYVIHSIVGNMNSSLKIDELNGKIYTINNNTFDYESQTEVFVQILAQDTLQADISPPHKTYARLTIIVLDENDETPVLKMPRVPASLEENSTESYVTNDIIATDPDTTAFLQFEIWWNESYATKYGQEVKLSLFEGCFEILEVPETKNIVYGHLIVKPEFYNKIDYEEYEVIYLKIRVYDRNQTYNQDYAEAILTVRITDINDCMPEFRDNTLNVERRVVEAAFTNTLIGTITAFDRDGPGNNVIKYSLIPIEGSPDGWASIDPETGVIFVNGDQLINCDIPKRSVLNYNVTLNDSKWIETGKIEIKLIDTNNRKPYFDTFQTTIWFKEKVTNSGFIIEHVTATDSDRDEIFHKIGYSIDYSENPKNLNFFDIDHESGMLTVSLKNGKYFDRDEGDQTHDIRLSISDNINGQGIINTNTSNIHIILIDVNDHKPEMPENFNPIFEEIQDIGFQTSDICATDLDAAKNAELGYEIVSILPKLNNAEPQPNMDGVFKIETLSNNCGRIETLKLLIGYYGIWDLNIRAYDHGDEDMFGMQENFKVYSLIINEHNLNKPNIIFPTENQSFRLRYVNQTIGAPLFFYNNTEMNTFKAIDKDGGKFGKVTFNLKSTEDNDDEEYFQMSNSVSNNGIHSSYIMLKKRIDKVLTFKLTITAIDGGDLESQTIPITITFINLEGVPYFKSEYQYIEFHENSTGLEESQKIQEAIDPWDEGKEEGEPKEINYYFIDETYEAEHAQYFKIDNLKAIVTLQSELDRESIDHHEFKVFASRSNNPLEPHDQASTTIVKVKVLDVNDNAPIFDSQDYGTGITINDYINKTLLTVRATDADLNDSLSYHMVPNSMKANGNNIENVKDSAFTLINVDETGVILLNFIPKANMDGYFEFQIEVRDEVLHTDHTIVKIYIVTEDDTVLFMFLNSVNEILADDNLQFLKDTFEGNFGYNSYIDDVSQGDINGVLQEKMANVRAHFVDKHEIVPANKIQVLSSDMVFITNLKTALFEKQLNLQDVPAKNSLDKEADTTKLLETILIVVSVVLGLLCIVLMITLFIRVRNLKRELNAITPVDMFGSTESNMNRMGAPTTNVFSVEGSNPVLNHQESCKGAFDNISIQSDESDFAGIANDLTFMPNEKRGSINPTLIEGMRRKSKNPMAHATENNEQ